MLISGNLGGPLLVTIKAALFFFPWPLEMSTTPTCPLLEIAAVCSYITGNSCQKRSLYARLFSIRLGLLCRLWCLFWELDWFSLRRTAVNGLEEDMGSQTDGDCLGASNRTQYCWTHGPYEYCSICSTCVEMTSFLWTSESTWGTPDAAQFAVCFCDFAKGLDIFWIWDIQALSLLLYTHNLRVL